MIESRPLEIQIVLHDLPLGGTERVALRLARAWADAGHRVRLFCGHAAGAQAGLVDPRVELAEASPPIPRGVGSRRRLAAAAAAHLRRQPADVLFIPGNFHWNLAGAVAAALGPRRPAIVAQVSSPLFLHGRNGLRQFAFEVGARARLRHADALVALSPTTLAEIDQVLGAGRATAIPLPALDDETTAPVRAEGQLILAAGRLSVEKGFDVALRSFARLDRRDARLAIVGDGPERAALEALASELGVRDRVEFAGYAPDIRPWLAQARLLLVTSWHEGFGAVIAEALGAGRPVVTTRCSPAVDDLLNGPARGRVAPLGDAAALAAALDAELSAVAPDPRGLVAAVAKHRLTPSAAAYLDVFRETIARRQAPAQRLVAPRTAGAFRSPALLEQSR